MANINLLEGFPNTPTVLREIAGPSSQYASIDNTVLYNGKPSVKLTADNTTRRTRELDCLWVNVKAGDHVVFRVKAKTSALAGSPSIYKGARIGMDMDAPVLGGIEIVDGVPHDYVNINGQWVSGTQGGYPLTDTFPAVPISRFLLPPNSDWTIIEWDIIIPSRIYTNTWFGRVALPTPSQTTKIAAWLDARELDDPPTVWFADAELYINPSEPPPSGSNMAGAVVAGVAIVAVVAGVAYAVTRKR